MPKIVQFTHPGGEHKPDNENKNHRSWNMGTHQRKFMLVNGRYVNKTGLQKDKLMFWGEWEPPSYVSRLETGGDSLLPKWLHRPYLPLEIPNPKGYQKCNEKSYQNTDPFVFGDSFKYFVCKQIVEAWKRRTQLAELDKGSIILFGSTSGRTSDVAFFQLDTVFVVGDYIEYDISDKNALKDESVSDTYRRIVYKMVFPKPADYSLKLRLYSGATYNNPYKGMYSFAPSKVYKNDISGFPRVQVRQKDLNFITNNLNAAPKYIKVTMEEATYYWEEIRKISINQGCVEGVNFEYENEVNRL